MQHNKLDGNLPAELAWMESMKHLNLGANDVRGEMFELDRMTNLRCVCPFHAAHVCPSQCPSLNNRSAGSRVGLSLWSTTA
eukprot:COSAG02_NODE_10_length_59045_cov_19.973365_16_plen_81_part_00